MNKTRILTGITLALLIVLSFLFLPLNAITLRVEVPIDPVDPNIATFFMPLNPSNKLELQS